MRRFGGHWTGLVAILFQIILGAVHHHGHLPVENHRLTVACAAPTACDGSGQPADSDDGDNCPICLGLRLAAHGVVPDSVVLPLLQATPVHAVWTETFALPAPAIAVRSRGPPTPDAAIPI